MTRTNIRVAQRATIVSPTLRKFGLFRNAPQSRLCPVGTTIFREGDTGDSMFAINRGRVATVV
jgi:hypothetical protein